MLCSKHKKCKTPKCIHKREHNRRFGCKTGKCCFAGNKEVRCAMSCNGVIVTI
jgi:hypothetical protein